MTFTSKIAKNCTKLVILSISFWALPANASLLQVFVSQLQQKKDAGPAVGLLKQLFPAKSTDAAKPEAEPLILEHGDADLGTELATDTETELEELQDIEAASVTATVGDGDDVAKLDDLKDFVEPNEVCSENVQDKPLGLIADELPGDAPVEKCHSEFGKAMQTVMLLELKEHLEGKLNGLDKKQLARYQALLNQK